MKKTIVKESFKQGDRYHLDDIYMVQGLGDGDWWEPIEEEDGECVTIKKNITIEIIVTK
jgi:hypothetical protein